MALAGVAGLIAQALDVPAGRWDCAQPIYQGRVRDQAVDALLTKAMEHWYAKQNVVGLPVVPLRAVATNLANALGAIHSPDADERRAASAAARKGVEAFEPVVDTLWRSGVQAEAQRDTLVLQPFPGWVALDARHLCAIVELADRLSVHLEHPTLRRPVQASTRCLERWLLPLAAALIGDDEQPQAPIRLRAVPDKSADRRRRWSVLDSHGERQGIVTEVTSFDGVSPPRYWVAHNPTAEPWCALWRAEGTPSLDVALRAFEAHLDGRLCFERAPIHRERCP